MFEYNTFIAFEYDLDKEHALMEKIQILIVDDHPMYRQGIKSALSLVSDFEIIGEASTGQEAINEAANLMPDIILMDIQMQDISGIQATRKILDVTPHIGIIIVTMFDDDDSLFSALRAGARGYLLKGSEHEEISRSVRAVAAGEAIFGAPIATRIINYFSAPQSRQQILPELTNREREVLELVANGITNKEIAQKLVISPKTVRNHVHNIFTKLHVNSRFEAIVLAREAGLADSDDT